ALFFVGLVGVGVSLQWEEHRISANNNEIFRQQLAILESRSHAGISGALLSYIIACIDAEEAKRLAFNLLKMTATNVDAGNQMNAILTAAHSCSPSISIDRQRDLSTESNFLRAVKLGFQSYNDGFS